MIDLQPDLELTTRDAERLLAAWLGGRVACSRITRLEGGLVNTVLRLDFDRPPHRAVVKLHARGEDSFAAESRALEHLRAGTSCPVPRVYLQDGTARVVPHAFLLLEHVPGVCLQGLPLGREDRADVERQLADVLVELHGHTGSRWGRLDDVVDAGQAPPSWADIVVARLVEARAHPALGDRLASDVLERVDESIERARPMLLDAGTPTLVHGDVWDGNVMVQQDGRRWRVTGLLDPDLQYADVELELAYLEVFDVPRHELFAAYGDRRPLRPGYERRRLVYWLHTALVHVALFGDEIFREFTARTAETICGPEPT